MRWVIATSIPSKPIIGRDHERYHSATLSEAFDSTQSHLFKQPTQPTVSESRLSGIRYVALCETAPLHDDNNENKRPRPRKLRLVAFVSVSV